MASVVPLIPIDLDRPRHLRLDNRALFHAEVEMSRIWNRKQNILSILLDSTSLTMTDVSIILWQGLLHEDPSLTLGEVQDMLDLGKAPQIAEAIYQAWNAAAAP